MDWLREKEISIEVSDLPAVFSSIGSIPVSRPTPEERQSDLDNALSWIRQGKPADQDISEKFKKIDAFLPTKKF